MNFPLALALFLAALAAPLAAAPPPVAAAPLPAAEGVWFNDLPAAALPLREEEGNKLCLELWRQLRSGQPPGDDFAAAFAADTQPRILFLSVSDGNRFPLLVCAGGRGLRAALLAGVRQVQARFAGAKLAALRLELVQQSLPVEQFRLRATPFARPGLVGLALPSEFPVALPADLLASGNCFGPGNVLVGPKVEEQLARAQLPLKTGFFWNRAYLPGQPLSVWYFETLAWHTDGQEVDLLFRNHAMPRPATAPRLRQAGDGLAAFLAGRLQEDAFTGKPLLNWPAPPFSRETLGDSALAAWALLEWRARHPDPDAVAAVRRALDKWLRERTRITPDNPACRQVVEDNDASPLEANAFLALALGRCRELAQEPKAWETELNQLANYLCAQVLENGDTVPSRELVGGAPGMTPGLHGAGVAALALARLQGQVVRTDCQERAERVASRLATRVLKGNDPVEPWSTLALAALAARPPAAAAAQAPVVARLGLRLGNGQTGSGLFPDFLGGWNDSADLRLGALHTLGLLHGARLLRDAGMADLADRQLVNAHVGLLYTLQGQNSPASTFYGSFTHVGGAFQRWLTAPVLSLEMQGLALLTLAAADAAAAGRPDGALPLTDDWRRRLASHRQQVLQFPRCLPPSPPP